MARTKARCLIVFFVTVCFSITLFGQKNYAQDGHGGDDIKALKQQIEDLRKEVLNLNKKVVELSSAHQGHTNAIENEDIENNTENDKKIEAIESRLNEMQGKLDKSTELYVREKEAQEASFKKDNTLNVYAPWLKSLKIGGESRVRFEDDLNFDFDDSRGGWKRVYIVADTAKF